MRSSLVLLVALLVALPAVGVSGGATATPASGAPTTVDVESDAHGDRDVGPSGHDGGVDPAGSESAESSIVERISLDRTPDRAGSVRVNVTYDLPDDVVSLTAESRYIRYDAVTLAGTEGFERQSDGSFAWDERTTAPTLSFAFEVPDTLESGSLGVEREDYAFVSLPNPSVSWRYRGTPPAFESERRTAGPGYATDAYALDGATSITSRSVRDVDLTVVVPPTARPEATADAYASLYRFGLRELDVGYDYASSGLYVLPDQHVDDDLALGTSTQYSFWVQDAYSGLDGVQSTSAHEFVHTRLGSFDDGSSRWLTEASAEYYGHVLSMNAGYGSWSEFRAAVAVERDAFRDATLAESSTWRDELVPYEKGALVLAALDAEIIERTGGVRSLQDVLAYRFTEGDPYGDLETYENLSAAVVATTGDESMREWLDRYVAGGETPPVPSDPDAFVLNDSMDSDDDGVPNGEEVRTNPFDADTDGDGVDDAADPSPTDDSRPEDAGTTTTATTATTTTTDTTATTTTTDTTATTTTTDTTATTTTVPSLTGSGTTTASETRSPVTSSRAPTDGASAGGSGGDVDSIPGFGPALAALAMLVVVVAMRD
ncbi:hypothetical protein [Halorubellus sp. PRR65]|uniref:hypothetical protein n=1 Tax=Halorubellus sp. PRR65 TaxID=3098148 RepID=UPI002B256ADC|nr:hypothetical protein [Halorubellus sp. PRR65]